MILGFMTDVRGRFLDAWNYYDPLKGSHGAAPRPTSKVVSTQLNLGWTLQTFGP